MEVKHKPCPFCGSEDLNIDPGANYVTCRSCESSGPTPKIDPFAMTQLETQLAIIWDAWDNRESEKPATFTQGPWFVRYCDDDSSMCMTVVSSKDYGPAKNPSFGDEKDTIAIVYHQRFPLVGDDSDVADANAKLIAAAPELYNLLWKVSLQFKYVNSKPPLLQEIQDILKKASGWR